MIFDLVKFHPKVALDSSNPTGVINRELDVTRARELLGWKPEVSIVEGLKNTIEWYVNLMREMGL